MLRRCFEMYLSPTLSPLCRQASTYNHYSVSRSKSSRKRLLFLWAWSGARKEWIWISVLSGFAISKGKLRIVLCYSPGALYTSVSRLSLSVTGAPLTMLWVQLWQIVWSKSVWALVACIVKWGSSKINSVVGTEDLLLLQEKGQDRVRYT